MGWLVSVFFIIYYFVSKETMVLVAAGMFAIAGSISFLYTTIDKTFGDKKTD